MEEMTTSYLGVDIVIPLKVKLSSTIVANQVDPNVEGAIAGLDAPQQPGEPTQAYEQ